MTERESAAIYIIGGTEPECAQNGSYEVAERLAAIVESSDDAIVSKDLNGVITSWNKGAENLFGYTAEEAIGKPITIIIPAEHQDEEPLILALIRRGERIDHYETVRRRKDGSLVDISLTVSPIKNAKGQIAGASKIARDITERKRAEEQQKLLLREMSHRIKNLFTVAGSIVALSVRGASTPEKMARSVQERLAALGRAHELTLTRPSPEAPLQTRPATLHALIQTILLPFENQGMGESKRASVTGLDLPIAPAHVTGFALLLHEFATNAAKYGALSIPCGRIHIDCSEENGQFIMNWKEYGSADIESEEEGFGTFLVKTTVKHQLGGEMVRERKAEGMAIRLGFPAARLAGGPGTNEAR
ncbi:MAG: PAS domain S-box protein [Rhodomicrobium sp.]